MRKKSTDLTDKQWKEIKPFRCSILSRRFKVETIFHRILQYIVFIVVVDFGTEFCNIFSKAFKILRQVNNLAMTQKKFGIKRQIATDKIGCLLAVVAYKAKIKKFLSTLSKNFYRSTWRMGLKVEISQKITPHGWKVIIHVDSAKITNIQCHQLKLWLKFLTFTLYSIVYEHTFLNKIFWVGDDEEWQMVK